jgi:hypothetical protein
MAQLVAHLLCKQGVRGSSPLGSTLLGTGQGLSPLARLTSCPSAARSGRGVAVSMQKAFDAAGRVVAVCDILPDLVPPASTPSWPMRA